jgi:hypothetical protein
MVTELVAAQLRQANHPSNLLKLSTSPDVPKPQPSIMATVQAQTILRDPQLLYLPPVGREACVGQLADAEANYSYWILFPITVVMVIAFQT